MFCRYYKVKSFQLCHIPLHYHTLTVESVLGTCVAYFADSYITEKWWNWLNTETDTRIGAALAETVQQC